MGRNVSGNYVIPNGTYGAENQTIESAKYNAFVDDIAADLNYARPILHGGTAATSSAQALVNLQGERSAMLVTNFDSHLWTSGSFYCSNASGQNAPVDGHAFIGICYSSDPPATPPANQNLVVEARDQSDSVVPGRLYIRQKKAGVWDAAGWKLDGRYIAGTTEGISGETADMFFGVTGTAPNSAFIVNTESDASGTNIFTIARTGYAVLKALGAAASQIFLDAGAGKASQIFGRANLLMRWALNMGNGATETGANVGNDFSINSYDDAGNFLRTPFQINRKTGQVAFSNDAVAYTNVTAGYGGSGGSYYFGNSGTKLLSHDGSNSFSFSASNVVVNGDLYSRRVDGSGVIYLGTTGRYLFWNEAAGTYTLPAGHLSVGLNISGNYITTNGAAFNGALALNAGGTFNGNITYNMSGWTGQAAAGLFMLQAPQYNQAMITFHNSSEFAMNFGLNSAGYMVKGGWSLGENVSYRIWDAQAGTMLTSVRLLFAADMAANSQIENYQGGLMTGLNNLGSLGHRIRYVQMFYPGAADFVTVGLAG